MDPQEVKVLYRELLDRYHSNEIDWNTFQAELFKLKQARATASASGYEEDDIDDLLDDESKNDFKSDDFDDAGNSTVGPRNLQSMGKETTVVQSGSGTQPNDAEKGKELTSVFHSLASSIFPRHNVEHQPRRNVSGHQIGLGDVLANRFTLQRLLGFGQCGATWRAKEEQTDNYVVVKLLPSAVQDDESAWKRFKQTFRQSATLSHESICPIYRLEWDERIGYFIVSAFLDAFPLNEYYDRYCRTLREFPDKAAIRILWPVAKALDFAHRRRTLHGSLKPQNILVGKYCGAMLTDFQFPQTVRQELNRQGLCTDAADDRPYRAPEIWTNGEYGTKSDQFALGVLAYQLLSGSLPFRAVSDEDLKSLILNQEPEPIKELDERQFAAIKRALSRNPSDRFSDCLHFVKELSRSEEKEEKSQSQQGPHFERSNKPSESPRPYWAVLFGLAEPTMPDWLAKENLNDRWPFQEKELHLDGQADRIPAKSTFPYATSPASNIAALTSGFTLPGLIVGSLATLAVGSAVALGANSLSGHHSGDKTQQGRNPVAEATNFSTPGEISEHSIETLADNLRKESTSQDKDKTAENAQNSSIPGFDLAEWVRQAEAGNLDSQRQLGEAYLLGGNIEKDEKKALRYFRLAAKSGDVASFYYLGLCYEHGYGGIVPDARTAVAWYEKSAEKGSEKGKDALKRLAVSISSAKDALDRLGIKDF